MKKILAAALVLTLFSSYIQPAEKPASNDCRLFRDTEFTYSCQDTQCTATSGNMTFSGDEESMKLLQTPEGKEMMDKMLQQILVQCLSGKSQPISEAEKEALLAQDK